MIKPAFGRSSNSARPNVVLITADDLNWNSVGAYGCPVEGATPNIDRLASQGIRFEHAHVTIAVCQPSRGVIATGRYPHRNGIEGFYHTDMEIPTIMQLLRDNGYAVGILGKVGHSTPRSDFIWDLTRDMEDLGLGRDPGLYYRYSKQFIRESIAAEKPFYLMANSHDPHRPFSGSDQEKNVWGDREITKPSRRFNGEEVIVPGFLPDLPEVRKEIAEYFSSVRRCDDTVGEILRAIDECGQFENTIVMFLSDNGMAFPFAKTNCYLHSTRTPWIVRWPEVVSAGRVDSEHMISGIDFMPTILEALGIPVPDGVDGRSFLPILRCESQADRDLVFTQFHETAARRRFPMRCVQSPRFGYIFNPWSDGELVFRNESQSGRTFAAMKSAAETDPAIAARVEFFLHRVPEEFYDFANDPDALNNLIDSPNYAREVDRMRSALLRWMRETGDPALGCFLNRGSKDSRKQFMTAQQTESNRRKENGRRR